MRITVIYDQYTLGWTIKRPLSICASFTDLFVITRLLQLRMLKCCHSKCAVCKSPEKLSEFVGPRIDRKTEVRGSLFICMGRHRGVYTVHK